MAADYGDKKGHNEEVDNMFGGMFDDVVETPVEQKPEPVVPEAPKPEATTARVADPKPEKPVRRNRPTKKKVATPREKNLEAVGEEKSRPEIGELYLWRYKGSALTDRSFKCSPEEKEWIYGMAERLEALNEEGDFEITATNLIILALIAFANDLGEARVQKVLDEELAEGGFLSGVRTGTRTTKVAFRMADQDWRILRMFKRNAEEADRPHWRKRTVSNMARVALKRIEEWEPQAVFDRMNAERRRAFNVYNYCPPFR